jgi:hypothetical protein
VRAADVGGDERAFRGDRSGWQAGWRPRSLLEHVSGSDRHGHPSAAEFGKLMTTIAIPMRQISIRVCRPDAARRTWRTRAMPPMSLICPEMQQIRFAHKQPCTAGRWRWFRMKG